MINVYEQVDQNKRRSIIVMVIFTVFVVSVTWIFSTILDYGLGTIGLALILAGLMSFGSYWYSDKLVLMISGAKPANREKHFHFYTVVENLCLGSGLPKPKLYVIEDTAPNAFATGRDPEHATICVTSGLLDKLNRTELEGVIAHELSHIRNYDIRLMSLVSILVGMIALLADWFFHGVRIRARDREGNSGTIIFFIGIVLAILSPIIGQLIQLAISRRREFLADASGVLLTKYPDGLISALEKISADKEPLEAANRATAHLYIINPLKGKEFTSGIVNLFNTHPPLEERIKALKGME